MYFIELLNNLYFCIKNKQYYAALVLALIIPDACSQVLYKLHEGDEDYYIQWTKEYVCTRFSPLYQYHMIEEPSPDSRVIYSLRNYMSHSGLPETKHRKIEKFYFAFNESSTKFYSHSERNGNIKYNINVPYLCNILYEAGRDFYSKHKNEFPTGNDYSEVIPDYMFIKNINNI